MVVADGAQHLHGGDDALGLFALDAQFLVDVGADGKVQRVVLIVQFLDGDVVADADPGFDMDPCRKETGDLAVEHFAGQAVGGDAVAEHAAQLLTLLVNGHVVPHDGQIIGGAQSAGAAADDGDFFARGGGALRHGDRLLVLHGVALKPADVDGIVDQRAAAASLAGMLADHAAHGG